MKLTILGIPLQKQSARFAKVGKFMRKYQPKQITNWQAQARLQIIQQLTPHFVPFGGKIRINRVVFIFPPLKSWSKKKLTALKEGNIIYKDTKPDMDNLKKMLYDCCNGLAWVDDAKIVVENNTSKQFGMIPRIEMEFEELEEI